MSSGPFVNSKYELNDGEIHPIRVQEETLTLNIGGVNAAPTGAVTGSGSVTVNKGVRENGIGARMVSLRWVSDAPATYLSAGTIRLPILTPAKFDSIAIGDTGTYLTNNVVVVGKTGEKIR